MATCREIPFIPYYGSVNATPLFVMLASDYLRWTNDAELRAGDVAGRRARPGVDVGDGRGAGPRLPRLRAPLALGLPNQGWKDSHDSVMHADGRLAEPPIALAEVQAISYAALLGAASWRRRSAARTEAPALRARARRLQNASKRTSGCRNEAFYALALDRDGAPCRVISSNPGHLLWTRIVSDSRARSSRGGFAAGRHVHGLGAAHAVEPRAAVQPDELSQRLGVAHDTALAAVGMRHYGMTSQFPHARHRPLRVRPAVRRHADARAVLRLPARGGYAPTR